MISDAEQQATLIASLKQPGSWPQRPSHVPVIETHISVVFLVGDFAYKLKKSLSLGFLDFSTLEKRRFYCAEEVRFNSRMAPQLYLGSVPVFGSANAPLIEVEDEETAPIEWLVKMRRFDERAVLSQCPERLTNGLMDQLAQSIARFHTQAAPSDGTTGYGSPEEVLKPMLENVQHIKQCLNDNARQVQLARLESWTLAQQVALQPLLSDRVRQGFVRECHGDLHLGNILLQTDGPLLFDGIEFSPSLHWIDVQSDLAFLLMDLTRQGRDDLARILLNTYLESSGDYAGLPLQPFYQVYRALVRAKVAAIRWGQPDQSPSARAAALKEVSDYLDLAERLCAPARPLLLINHGVSGSGKSWFSRQLVAQWPLIRLSSDVERKRLAGMAPLGRGDERLYSVAMTQRVYDRLLALAERLLEVGIPVLVDATFLHQENRVRFRQMALDHSVPFGILDFVAPEAELRHRVQERIDRNDDVSDATLAVLEKQLQEREPLSLKEVSWALPTANLDSTLAAIDALSNQ